MKIREISATRGPNYWSVKRSRLIVMVLDLEEMELYPSDEVEGFNDRLKQLIPTLSEHFCSIGKPGGFFKRLEEGTWMGHIIEHIALEIQVLAGMEVFFGRTRGYGQKGVYHVVFEYIDEEAGRYAAKAAVRICQAIISDEIYDLEKDIEELREIYADGKLGPSTTALIKEAERRGIPWFRLNDGSLCQLGYGIKQQRIEATVTGKTSHIALDIACNKEETKQLLRNSEIRVPKGVAIREFSELEEACTKVGFPLAVKPVNGNHGRGITSGIQNIQEAAEAFQIAKEISDTLIIEEHITGKDYRMLVINHKFAAAAQRSPAQVTGDGMSTITQLIENINKDPRRGYHHNNLLTRIELDENSLQLMDKKGYSPQSILPDGENLVLKDTANLSTGGTAEDVTDSVHPSNVFLAERIARIIGLDLCGIDIISTDISKPVQDTGGCVIEVNAGPGLRMHLAPTKGLARNVAAPVMDSLFPENNNGRIPIIAVTGTNGKTTTTRLISHIAQTAGKTVGYTTTDGVYINNYMIMKGDCTGPLSTELILKDPCVDFAVLECARGGLLRAGLAFRYCDIGIVTNVEGDHLGLDGIHTQEQLARVKSVIPETVRPEGYAILNADDDMVYDMRRNLESKFALFSMDENNSRIKQLQEQGGLTAIYENGYVSLTEGTYKTRLLKAEAIPLTFGGMAKFMTQNILPAVLSAKISGFTLEEIKKGLKSFIPSQEQTPGRLNVFRFRNFSFMLDYAHNPTGMRALKQFTDLLGFKHKVGIIAGIGDRLDKDTEEIGMIAAEMFDEIIIREDRDLRGKSSEYLTALLRNGINKIDPKKLVTLAGSELESIKYAIRNAKKDSLIVLCSDAVADSLKLLNELQQKDEKGELKFENSFWMNTL